MPLCFCHRCNAGGFAASVEVAFALDVQNRRHDGHDKRVKLRLRRLREEARAGIHLATAGRPAAWPLERAA
eukprot:11166050-Lingulodinium_polyedra.AAC.1